MMLRLFLCFTLGLALAGPVRSACDGRNLLDEMPPAARAAIDARVRSDAFAEGNHWRATRRDSVIDLIGTFHIHDARMPAIVERLAPLVRASDGLWLEATETETGRLKSAMTRNPTLMFSDGPTLPERLDKDEWTALSAALSARGMPPFMASKMRPWFVSLLLSIPPCAMNRSGQPDDGLDAMLEKEARKAGVAVAALEPWDTILAIFGSMEQTDQIEALRSALLLADQSEDFFATMTTAYFDEQHRMIWELSRAIALQATNPETAARDFAMMEQILLVDRNHAWIDVIVAAATGKHIVVAVGAAHLPGPDGVLALLERRGYRLERAAF